MKNILGCLLLSSLSLSALAEEGALVKRFRQSALNVVETAEKRGQNEVQGVTFEALKKVIQETPVYHSPNLTQHIGNRRCALWRPAMEGIDRKTGRQFTVAAHIYLNNECSEVSDKNLGRLSVHEFFGAGFGIDRDYSPSTEVIIGKRPSSPLIDEAKLLEALKQRSLNSGGSTGVGGGGDLADFRFKELGLEFLRGLPQSRVLGIPKPMMDVAIQRMKISPAADIEKMMEFRAAGIEGPNAILYVKSHLYRGKNEEILPMMALVAARLFVLYAAEDIGLADARLGRHFLTSSLNAPVTMIPMENNEVSLFKNEALHDSMIKEQRAETFNMQIKEIAQKDPILEEMTEWIRQNVFLRLK